MAISFNIRAMKLEPIRLFMLGSGGGTMQLIRHLGNPILTPRGDNRWESKLTFNPGIYMDGSKIHILYRAVDENDISYIGYASSSDGRHIDERLAKPVISPEYEWENLGVEDVRVNSIDGHIYITYTALSNKGARVAIAETEDFRTFRKMGLIGPDYYDKDAVIFPKRIDGKIILLHRISPNIQAAYFESVEDIIKPPLSYWEEHMANLEAFTLLKPKQKWEARKIGSGPPPIETDRGWLLIYHGVDDEKSYKVGAVLLDLDNPLKILGRTTEPLLEPSVWYEHWGCVPEVVFPTGVALLDNTLYTYYGAADTTCCVATVNIHDLLEHLKSGK
jgi:predicted GH43/DUF377 family glycosyl hydrolase